MAKGAYIGIGNSSRKVKNIYTGIGNIAKKVTKAYIGVGGLAKLWWKPSTGKYVVDETYDEHDTTTRKFLQDYDGSDQFQCHLGNTVYSCATGVNYGGWDDRFTVSLGMFNTTNQTFNDISTGIISHFSGHRAASNTQTYAISIGGSVYLANQNGLTSQRINIPADSNGYTFDEGRLFGFSNIFLVYCDTDHTNLLARMLYSNGTVGSVIRLGGGIATYGPTRGTSFGNTAILLIGDRYISQVTSSGVVNTNRLGYYHSGTIGIYTDYTNYDNTGAVAICRAVTAADVIYSNLTVRNPPLDFPYDAYVFGSTFIVNNKHYMLPSRANYNSGGAVVYDNNLVQSREIIPGFSDVVYPAASSTCYVHGYGDSLYVSTRIMLNGQYKFRNIAYIASL